ncbi:WD repeat-containing protein 90 isoform X2 [Synchiropus splendidus]|uniref:WD repeat-containing protein 90 isoform X2 n=1 Tax=Synchiropus splendidus TaxID=270530 RepID=UPI00237E18F7|nr:WD repeat-containing protein 90 isoform X2 [Synchiropus splendidus]
MASQGWQHPYVNIFKHVKVEEWRKSAKEGDVSTYTDKTIKCSVFRIRSSFTANSYILVPKYSHQSLGLTGRYFYLLFKPIPSTYFVVHLDVAVKEGQVVRISFSNMFKEFKCSPTSIQLPFVFEESFDVEHEAPGVVGQTPTKVRWICLTLDLQHTLSAFINCSYNYLKTIRLCSNMSVKNMFTSHLQLDPGLSFSEAKIKGLKCPLGSAPMPRDMVFPVPKGRQWHEIYDYIRFPLDEAKVPIKSIQKRKPTLACVVPAHSSPCNEDPHCVGDGESRHDSVSAVKQLPPPTSPQRMNHGDNWLIYDDDDDGDQDSRSNWCPLTSRPPCNSEGDGIHVYVHPDGETLEDSVESEEEVKLASVPVAAETAFCEETEQKLQPDPILRLSRIIGFGGATTNSVLWTKSGDSVVYPCHAIIVCMKISTKAQRFFIGHTDKVNTMALNGETTLLASAQTGQHCVIRVWNFNKGCCLSVFRVRAHVITSLSFSYDGGILCGVGKDGQQKTLVVVWSTVTVKHGQVNILAKSHVAVDIHTMKVDPLDDKRMVSCGRDNIRFWRLRNGTLRSCPVDINGHHLSDITDVAFEEGKLGDERTLFASSRNGHIIEINYNRSTVKHVRRLFSAPKQGTKNEEQLTFNAGPGIAITSISVSSSFCATGSEDGVLRLWPLNFSAVFLEAEHEGPVSLVSISPNGLLVLAATVTGVLGFLDVSSRGYSTLMRSHTDTVLGFSVDGIRRHLTTASSDGTVRVWSMDSLHQLYDFVSEDHPCSVTFHPSEQVFSCGFTSGVVRIFDISTAKLLAEHKQHSGEVVGLAFSPNGDLMYSAGSEGSLALYDACEEQHGVVRVACDVVAQGTLHAPEALTVSSDGCCLAFVGPTEHIVTIADAHSLDELHQIQVSNLDVHSAKMDSALKLCFSPASAEHLLIATSANAVLWVSTKMAQVLRKISNVHKHQCSSMAVSKASQFLLTAGQNTLKVWHYHMTHLHPQTFIGPSQPIKQVSFTPDQLGVISVGDAIFLWDFLAAPTSLLTSKGSPLTLDSISAATSDSINGYQVSNGVPRQTAPLPASSPPRLDTDNVDHRGSIELTSDQRGGHLISTQTSTSAPVTDAGPGSSLHSQSFLPVTELPSATPKNTTTTSIAEALRKKPHRPDCYIHFIPCSKSLRSDQATVASQQGEEGLRLHTVIGYNSNGRGNMIWSPEQGLFAYSCGSVVVIEDLNTGRQRHLHGHREEVFCLAITSDAQMLVSAACAGHQKLSNICIWDVPTGLCSKSISHHGGAVQSLTFSRDDRFLLSIGDFSNPELALWSCCTGQMLYSVSVSGSVHAGAFSPTAASQMACVGSRGVYFGLLHSRGLQVEMKLQGVRTPAALGKVEMTALCYHTDCLLFTATNRGHVCVWDIKTHTCFKTWEADEGEIGMLLCKGNRLLTGSSTQWLKLWEVEGVEPQEKVSYKKHSSNSETPVVLKQHSLDGAIISAAFDHTMDMGIAGTTAGTLWNVHWSQNSVFRLVTGHDSKVNEVVFSHDESHFATCTEDGRLRVWSAPSNELTVEFQVLKQSCRCVSWSPTSVASISLAAGYSDGTLRLFQLFPPDMKIKVKPYDVAVSAIQFSAEGHVILTAGINGLIVVHCVITGKVIRLFKDHQGAQISSLQCVNEQCNLAGFEGNEMWLAASADRRVSVWAADWLKSKCELLEWLSLPAPAYLEDESPPPSLAAFCPGDPSLLVYTGYGVEKEMCFYSLVKKRIIKKIALPHWVTCFSLSPQSELIAVGSKERVLKLIKGSSGRFQDYLQHSDYLQSCHFSPSGKRLFTVAHNEMMLWEVLGL